MHIASKLVLIIINGTVYYLETMLQPRKYAQLI